MSDRIPSKPESPFDSWSDAASDNPAAGTPPAPAPSEAIILPAAASAETGGGMIRTPSPASDSADAAMTLPNRPTATVIRKMIDALAPKPEPVALAMDDTPWTLQQFFNGEIDLDAELAQRFQSMPLMSTIHFRSLGTKSKRGVATLATQDGEAQVIIDVDAASRVAQFSFTFGSMLTLRFRLDDLQDTHRTRWLDLMRRKEGGLTFLWGEMRWERDYLICVSRRYFTNLYAFSTNNFEAAVRLTPETTKTLLDWLDTFWKAAPSKDEPPTLLTW